MLCSSSTADQALKRMTDRIPMAIHIAPPNRLFDEPGLPRLGE
jgi:hypothetical protein